MKKQIIVIHGGSTFDSYESYLDDLKALVIDPKRLKSKSWREFLQTDLGSDFDVICLTMPNKNNAKYIEWKILFDKVLPFLSKDLIFLGHSLGGIFLVKYLSENILENKIKGLFLVAPPFSKETFKDSLADFILSADFDKLQKQVRIIRIYQSKDDPIVSFDNAQKYNDVLKNSNLITFENRGHFNQEKFPEIVDDIKRLCQ